MEKPYKIGCVIPVSGRPGLVNKTITMLKKQRGCDMTIICVGSEEQDRVNILDGNKPEDFKFLIYRNAPLGAKWQFGIDTLRNIRPDIDAYLHTGSDEWLTEDYCSSGIEAMSSDLGMAGVKGFYLYEAETKRMIYWPGYAGDRNGEPIGAGRLVTRKTLESLNWSMVDTGLDSNLDASMMKNVLKTGACISILDDKAVAVIGIKTGAWAIKNSFASFLKEGHAIPTLMARNFIESNFPGIDELNLSPQEK